MAEALRSVLRAARVLNAEQRVAAIAALLLIASTFGPFSFVEAAEVLVALGVLALLFARVEGKRFHLPFGDGTAVAAAGAWAGLLIVVRLLDRPLGQNLLALACAAILVLAGARERAKRPADDLPPEHTTPPMGRGDRARGDAARGPEAGAAGAGPGEEAGAAAPGPAAEARPVDDETEPLPPPEFDPGRGGSEPARSAKEAHSGEQLRLAEEPGDEAETRRLPEARPPDA